MDKKPRLIAACSCETTMPIDLSALSKGCGCEVRGAKQLCGAEISVLQGMFGEGRPLTVACTQEIATFEEAANETPFRDAMQFVNIRENAGWSDEAAYAAPKMAALLAAAAIDVPRASLVTLKSNGVVLIYGKDEVAIEAGEKLKDNLDVTVILTGNEVVLPRSHNNFPIARGRIVAAKGHLGAFELTVEDFALPSPSSRGALVFGPGRRGTSKADLVLDLSGGTPLFPAPELRQGYLRAGPQSRIDVANAIYEASHLVGEFDKPRYIRYREDLCAHQRSMKTGCTRCLELCPAGAITANGNHVAISEAICMGCGQCASVCPTGAAVYDYPPTATVLSQVRAMLLAYRAAGGSSPVLLFHDDDHGRPLIDTLARLGRGLPARVIPVSVNEVTQLGLETLAASVAYGASHVRFLLRAKPKHSPDGLVRNIEYARSILDGLGFTAVSLDLIETDDPDALRVALDEISTQPNAAKPREFLAMGAGRGLLRLTLSELRAAAPVSPAVIPLAARAPIGGLKVNVEGCTLCLACVSACPTAALTAAEDSPMLRFAEDLCVQCSLCQSTCPERVIALDPRLNFEAWTSPPVVIKQEEPFHCIVCAKPFGVKSTIERISAKLTNQHWMFSGANAGRAEVIKMCDDCRVQTVMNEGFDPHAAPARPNPKTTADYLREREETQS